MMEPKDFYFIRHGETNWNRERLGMGQKDIPLNDKGIEQAASAASILQKISLPIIFHSPLSRARNTAQIIAEKTESRLIEIPELIECSWGEREGDVKGLWLEEWFKGSRITGAELYSEFILRSLRAINHCLKSSQEAPLIVAHGGTFFAIQEFAKLGSHYEVPNAVPLFLRAPSGEFKTVPNEALNWQCTPVS